MVPSHTPRRRAPRRRRRSTLSGRGGRVVVAGLLGLAVLIVLVVAAFSSSVPTFQDSLPGGGAQLFAGSRPLPQVVAYQDSLAIKLPISQRAVTALGYHGSGGSALPLKPVGRQANEGLLGRMIHWLFGGGGQGVTYYSLGGEGSSTGALDVGAADGTDVYSPVDGTVVSVGDFVLDGKAYGNTIQIQPADQPSVVVLVTRLRADPVLGVGSPVSAGTSKIGAVIDLSATERQALSKITHDAGNHVTIEVDPAATLPVR